MRWHGLAIAFLEEFRMFLSGHGQNLPEDLDPIRHLALALAVPTPEEISGMCVGTRWHVAQLLGHIMRQKAIHRRACFPLRLLLIKKDRIVVPQLVPGQAGGVTSTQPAPA